MTAGKIDLTSFLNQQYLCESLTIKEIQTLLDYTKLVDFKKNDVIADIDEVGEALYFVIEGEVALYYNEAGQETEIGRIKEGELVGEMSFFDKRPRSVGVRAMAAETQLLKLTRVMYDRLRVEHPFIAVNFLEHAIISLDHLFRRLSSDVATFANYYYGPGRK
jgi:CRP-like cAMP-binding protein